MSEASPKILLHYRLVEKIGEGGMGVVWKALDTTLNREVAIKILPDLFADDAERLARFEREAKLLASLNHPNIAGIFGIHEASGTRFLAMELVEGQDLHQRLSRGALTRKEALNVALQIAHAFESAHESGVVHRDLKPANVKMTSDGKVKVLDFGLAKALAGDPSGPGASPSMSPTLTSAGTVAGMVLGTASYMSPEQAKGKEVDRRADIWSFGVVLFEMLTGRKLFEGETISETLAAVIMKEIDWGALPADTPPSVRRLLERCLQRDPRSRMRDIGDARIAIEETLRTPEESVVAQPSIAQRPARAAWIPWMISVLALVALGWVGWSGRKEAPSSPVMRFTMSIDEDLPVNQTPIPALAISSDGTRVAYAGTVGNTDMLVLRHVHQHEAVALKGTEGADNPFFSPDGEWIGFESGGKLKKISVLGGPPMTLCDAPRLRGASWGSDGTIVFAPNRHGGLMRVSEAGGDPEWLTLSDVGEGLGQPSDRWPDFVPESETVIFTSTENNSNYVDAEIAALDLKDMTRKTLVKGGTYARFVPPGFLVYAREATLFASRFDPKRVEVIGPAVPVLEALSGSTSYGSKHLAFSYNGTLIYLTGGGDGTTESPVWLDREARETPAASQEGDYSNLRPSPDGRRLVVGLRPDNDTMADIWIIDLERDTSSRLTFHEARDDFPVWSPDGEWVVFASERDGLPNLYRKRSDGTGEVERLTTADRAQLPQSWSPDGKMLAFLEIGESGPDIMFYRFGEEPAIETFVAASFREITPAFSPDGRWIAYSSDESGELEVHVRPTSGGGAGVRVSTGGGVNPEWGPDGKELFYHDNKGTMMAVGCSVQDGRFRPGIPEPLFEYRVPPLSWIFAIAPDGRFAAYKDLMPDLSTRREPRVVINWFDELESKVPPAR